MNPAGVFLFSLIALYMIITIHYSAYTFKKYKKTINRKAAAFLGVIFTSWTSIATFALILVISAANIKLYIPRSALLTIALVSLPSITFLVSCFVKFVFLFRNEKTIKRDFFRKMILRSVLITIITYLIAIALVSLYSMWLLK